MALSRPFCHNFLFYLCCCWCCRRCRWQRLFEWNNTRNCEYEWINAASVLFVCNIVTILFCVCLASLFKVIYYFFCDSLPLVIRTIVECWLWWIGFFSCNNSFLNGIHTKPLHSNAEFFVLLKFICFLLQPPMVSLFVYVILIILCFCLHSIALNI